MPKTKLEQSISHRKRRSGILVPILEDRLRYPLDIEDEVDAQFLYDLAMKQIAREADRNNIPKFSPSSLASCIRQVYLKRNFQDYDLVPVRLPKTEPNYYFMKGDWTHMMWQFALYRLHREGHPHVRFPGNPIDWVEIPVVSKHGDHGGTLDALPLIYDEPFVVDFKGLNVRDFGKIASGYQPTDYRIQVGDYMMLANVDRSVKLPKKIERGLLVVESKGGPVRNHPAALVETEIYMDEVLKEIHTRLEVLRKYEREKEIPPPSCVSTREFQFTGCPFAGFCKEEVKAIERARRAESGDPEGFRVAVPKGRRTSRARGNSK